MPRFVFNIISPDRVVTDHTGTEVAGLEAAHWHAVGHLVGAQLTIPAQLWLGGDCLDWETQDASTALIDRDVAGGDLVFVGGEGCQNFALLAFRDLEEVQGPSEFGCDFIEQIPA